MDFHLIVAIVVVAIDIVAIVAIASSCLLFLANNVSQRHDFQDLLLIFANAVCTSVYTIVLSFCVMLYSTYGGLNA